MPKEIAKKKSNGANVGFVKKLLNKYKYPPDKQEQATKTVLEQAEILCKDWTGE